ncbi:MAG: hypothetical protein A2287_02075 [Candidatus Melainabacteria bacterium RIFOXYA12_FULL_32_12]|nr:MAG: hypothetical protein A2255_10595 [Candidatus Melainabacteria bacterium RIFOXYA2_FULL_32_9]OGI31533.1 MAG: hypothetical protein A2287_02075 [Candidatus Melainabacteria bacterium RIFOXYA12_FULL_32_12]
MTNIPSDGVRGSSLGHKKEKKQSIQKTEQSNTPEIQKDIDLRNDPTQVLGRSQVKSSKIKIDPKTFDPETVKNIEGDLDILRDNPKLVTGSDKVFNHHYKETNDYPESADLQKRFVDEFAHKSK